MSERGLAVLDLLEERRPERVLVVIPCLNEEKYIEKVLQKLNDESQSLPMFIVVADGGSTDQTSKIVRSFSQYNSNIVFFSHPKVTQGPGINAAVRHFGEDFEYLIRIDAHADYPEDYCRRLVDEADKTQAAFVVVSMKTEGKTWFQKTAAAAQNSRLGNGGSAHRMTGGDGMWIDHGHHALMRIDTFRSLNGYDETFTHNEDAELDARVIKKGHRIWLTGKTSLTYYPRETTSSLFKQYMNYGTGRARNILKNHTMPKLRQLAPAAVLPAIILGLWGPISALATIPFWCWVAICLGYGILLSIKAKDARILMSGPLAMVMHLSWSVGFWVGLLDALPTKNNMQ